MKMRSWSRIVLVVAFGVTLFATTFRDAEVQAVNSIRAVDISVGGEGARGYGCAILLSHEVLCWGNNAPVSGIIPGIDDAVVVSAGVEHTCVALRTGRVKCWGSNRNGQLGNGTQNSSTSPVTVIGVGGSGALSNIVEVAASAKYDFTCALSSAGNVMCWGFNSHGGIGNPSVSTYTSTATPVNVLELSTNNPLTGVKTIAVGSYATCAVKTSGAAFCWGDNGLGQLGNPRQGSTNAAVPVSGVGGTGDLTDATQIALGDAMGCARRSNGAVACWGMNQVGDGTGNGSGSPVAVIGVSSAIQVSTAQENACVLAVNGDVKCWGNWHGSGGSLASQQVFSSTDSPSGAPILTNARKLASGGGWPQKYCAILNDDTVRCWGANPSGELGVDSNLTPYSNVPIEPQQSFVMGAVTTSSMITTTTPTTVPTSTTTSTTPNTATTTSVPKTAVNATSPVTATESSSGSVPTTSAQGQKTIARVTSPALAPTSTVLATTTTPTTVPKEEGPSPAKVETGQGSFFRNGLIQELAVTRVANQVVMSTGQQKVILRILDSNEERLPLDKNGDIDLANSAYIDFDLRGFTPDDVVSIWMFSTATKLGESTVGSGGNATGRFSLPSKVENGAHRLVVSVGSSPESASVFTLGVIVSGESKRATLTRVLIVVPIALAIVIGLLVPGQMRRRLRRKTAL